ncbi:unnamed protein product [Linum tenue]|uniref:Uncharacterized protein n=1 Tax=Linum tenue TaxID=586396 RepID=A0AAV0NBD9_9ROSI|nr:unnamed protein product [Linum tenue]
MAPFEFNSTTHFLASYDSTTIDVYELMISSTSSPPSAVRATDCKLVTIIATCSRDQLEENQYDALKLFDEEIAGRDLRNLAEDLSQSHFYVNPLGNTFIDVSGGGGGFVDPAFGVQFFRLNDTFNWSQYGAVRPPPPSSVANLWDTRHGFPCRSGEKSEAIVDYKKQLKEKDEKLGELKTQLKSNTIDLESAKRDLEKYQKWCYDFSPVRCWVPSFKEEAIDAFWLLDEDCGGLPPPPTVQVWNADGKFDAENWWCIKANRRMQGGGETTMLVYYDGDFDYAVIDNPMTSRKERVSVPYKVKNGEFAADRNFSLGYFPFTWETPVELVPSLERGHGGGDGVQPSPLAHGDDGDGGGVLRTCVEEEHGDGDDVHEMREPSPLAREQELEGPWMERESWTCDEHLLQPTLHHKFTTQN